MSIIRQFGYSFIREHHHNSVQGHVNSCEKFSYIFELHLLTNTPL